MMKLALMCVACLMQSAPPDDGLPVPEMETVSLPAAVANIKTACPCDRENCKCQGLCQCLIKARLAEYAPKAAPAVALAAPAPYPVRSATWGHPGNVKQHLKTGIHAGKFDPAWIDSLTNAQAEALHSDDHEGRVKPQAVMAGQYAAAYRKTYRIKTYRRSCVGGRCG